MTPYEQWQHLHIRTQVPAVFGRPALRNTGLSDLIFTLDAGNGSGYWYFTATAPRRVHHLFSPIRTSHRLSEEKKTDYYSSSQLFTF
jgi:hypothetical protein